MALTPATPPVQADDAIVAGPGASSGAAAISPVRAAFGLGILVLLTILSYIDRTIIILLVEPIKADLAINDVQFSLLTGLSFALVYGVFGLLFGWLADRMSRRWIIAIGVFAWSIATALCGLATSFASLFAARMGVGIGEAALSPVGYAIVGDMFPRRRLAFATGILAAGTVVGASLAYGVGGFLIEWANANGGVLGLRPWQTAIVLVAVPGLVLAPLVFVIPRQADGGGRGAAVASAGPAEGYGRWLRANLSHLLPMTIGAALVYALVFGVTAWLPAVLFRTYALSPAEVGSAMGIALGFSGIVGFLGGGWIVDRLAASRARHVHLRYMTAAILGAGVAGVVAFTLAVTSVQLLVLIAILSLVSPINGPALAYLRLHTPERYRGRTIALFLLIFNLAGMTVGPSAAAIAAQLMFAGEIGGGLAVLSAVCGIAGTGLFLYAARNEPGAAAGRDA